jgi:L-lysine 6-transaminase
MNYPGPISLALIEEMQGYVKYDPWPFALDLSRGHGPYLVTVDDQQIFDWAGYYGSKLIAHNHPALQEPTYLRKLATAANNKTANPDFVTPECLAYYRLLYRLAPDTMKRIGLEVYAVNSGAEAVENMLKYFVSMHNAKQIGRQKPRRFIYFDKAFHGRTVYALNVTQTIDAVATRDFRGLIAETNIQIPFPAIDVDLPNEQNEAIVDESLSLLDAILRTQKDEIVGIIVEPFQGAGGQRITLPRFFTRLSEIAHQHDVYLGFDEVQTSGGSTGTVFATEQFELPYPPDAIAVGKKFACGALYMRDTLPDVGVLDSTWGGTLADMVRFVQEWEVVENEDLVTKAKSKGDQLRDGLRSLQNTFPSKIGNIRGMGLYQGFTCLQRGSKARLLSIALQNYDLLLLGAGVNSIRTRPNLSITEAEIDLFIETLGNALKVL